MAKERRDHVAVRSCAACRRRFPKEQLNRFVSTTEGLAPDPVGKKPGRGAYLCSDPECWVLAAKRLSVFRAAKSLGNKALAKEWARLFCAGEWPPEAGD